MGPEIIAIIAVCSTVGGVGVIAAARAGWKHVKEYINHQRHHNTVTETTTEEHRPDGTKVKTIVVKRESSFTEDTKNTATDQRNGSEAIEQGVGKAIAALPKLVGDFIPQSEDITDKAQKVLKLAKGNSDTASTASEEDSDTEEPVVVAAAGKQTDYSKLTVVTAQPSGEFETPHAVERTVSQPAAHDGLSFAVDHLPFANSQSVRVTKTGMTSIPSMGTMMTKAAEAAAHAAAQAVAGMLNGQLETQRHEIEELKKQIAASAPSSAPSSVPSSPTHSESRASQGKLSLQATTSTCTEDDDDYEDSNHPTPAEQRSPASTIIIDTKYIDPLDIRDEDTPTNLAEATQLSELSKGQKALLARCFYNWSAKRDSLQITPNIAAGEPATPQDINSVIPIALNAWGSSDSIKDPHLPIMARQGTDLVMEEISSPNPRAPGKLHVNDSLGSLEGLGGVLSPSDVYYTDLAGSDSPLAS